MSKYTKKVKSSAEDIATQLRPLLAFLDKVKRDESVDVKEISAAFSTLSSDGALRFYPHSVDVLFFCTCGERYSTNLECRNCDPAIQN